MYRYSSVSEDSWTAVLWLVAGLAAVSAALHWVSMDVEDSEMKTTG